jgi:hypothetical protein
MADAGLDLRNADLFVEPLPAPESRSILRAKTRTTTHFNDAFNPGRPRPSGFLSLIG